MTKKGMVGTGRVSTGVYGLDDLLYGGLRENTINIVKGGTGAGKTTFALQYSLFGLNRGEKVIFISFEMSEEQIIRDSKDIGWEEIESHISHGNLKILHLFGEDLMFPSLTLAEMVKTLKPANGVRIVIDPLTYPTFHSEKEKRKSLSTIFQELRRFGTSVVVLEEPADSLSEAMPLYLADTVLYLQNLGFGEMYDRTLRIMKHRGSKHGEGIYPYSIETGFGIVLHTSEKQIEKVKPKTKFDSAFEEAIENIKNKGALGKILSKRLKLLQKNWTREESPSKTLELVLKEEFKEHDKGT